MRIDSVRLTRREKEDEMPKLKEKAGAVEPMVMALEGRKVWIPKAQGGYEEAYVHGVLVLTVKDKNKHPSAQMITESILSDVKFKKP